MTVQAIKMQAYKKKVMINTQPQPQPETESMDKLYKVLMYQSIYKPSQAGSTN